MNTKTRGFTLIELLEAIVVVTIFILIMTMGLVSWGGFSKAKNSESDLNGQKYSVPQSEDIIVRERGMVGGYEYIVFEDKATKTRIFCFNKAMTFLPKKD